MNDAREHLKELINRFSTEGWHRFFRMKSGHYSPINEDFSRYEDEDFHFGIKLGEIQIPETGEQLLFCAFQVQKALSERSGKKAQYEKAKRILRSPENLRYQAGIFVFYDSNTNFRFSLIYPEAKGTRREWSNFKRFTYFVSRDLTNKTFLQRIGNGNFSSLEKIKEAFSVEKVTKEFYQAIANWYFWTLRHSQFPKDAEAEEHGRDMAIIRLITRIIFIWFMRERDLIPKELFDERKLKDILKDLSSDQSSYYTAILQNLFFATLSTKKNERSFRDDLKGHHGWNPDFGNQYVFRYQELFQDPDLIKSYFKEIPFLNGGLFDCLDDKKNGIIIDGFSRTKKNQPEVPNMLFFGKEREIDLSKIYGSKKKKYKVRGLFNILSSYNFTIDENTPDDADIALDPEMLGRVFENLLASFNPETKTTARKATGSYYTPREIVDYMVCESLKAYFKTHIKSVHDLDNKLEILFSYDVDSNPFTLQESKILVSLIENVKIVDPAVGSGAFPMGALNRLVFVLNKIDPNNNLWKEAQLRIIDNILDPENRQKEKERVEIYFKEKNIDYLRKIYLIQRCIYGVDLQAIAVEIAKLRFFISLLVDEKIDKNKDNWGIEPLPNLDFKIMQGNSLISEFMGIDFDDDVKENNSIQSGLSFETPLKKLIQKFEQKKVDFQNEADREKKAVLKHEIEELLIGIFEEKIKKIKTDYFRQIEAIEKKYVLLPNKEQRETIIKQEKSRYVQRSDFNIDAIEEQLCDFTGKKKQRPFFPWKLYFAEVYEKGGFDIVIANPPYVRADDPSIKEQRSLILQSKNYETLWEKWDLFVAFIEKGFKLLRDEGVLEFIISDAYMTSKYAEKSQEYFLKYASINRINFLNDIKVFDAGVKNIIIEYQKMISGDSIPTKIKHSPTFDDFIYLPTKKQKDLGKYAFRLEMGKEHIGNLSNTMRWGKICYVSYGLRPSSDERFYKGEFKKEDLISDNIDNLHPKKYVEGKWIKKYFIEQKKYLEWGTDRSPKKLVRPTFPELYIPKKIIRGRMTNAIFDEMGLLCNDSCFISVFWKDLHNVDNRSIVGSIKKDFKISDVSQFRKILESNSEGFDLKYLLAILNSKLGNFYLSQVRRSQLGFYPDDLKKLPIKKISSESQQPFINNVDQILKITKSSDYIQNQQKNTQVKQYINHLDIMIYKLYELTYDEVCIVDPEFVNVMGREEYEKFNVG